MNALQSQSSTIPVKEVTTMPMGRAKTYVIYDFEKNLGIYLSDRERMAVDVYLGCFNYAETCRAIKVKYPGFRGNGEALKKWFERDHVREYFKVKLDEKGLTNGWTKEKWVSECTKEMMNPSQASKTRKMFLELLGDALGYMQGSSAVFKADNMQFNFTQADGNR